MYQHLSNEQFNLLDLMPELLDMTFANLPIKDIVPFLLINRRANKIILNSSLWQGFWQHMVTHEHAQSTIASIKETDETSDTTSTEQISYFAKFKRASIERQYPSVPAWVIKIFYLIKFHQHEENIHEKIIEAIESKIKPIAIKQEDEEKEKEMEQSHSTWSKVSELLSAYDKDGLTIPVLAKKNHGQELLNNIYILVCNYIEKKYHFHCAIALGQIEELKNFTNLTARVNNAVLDSQEGKPLEENKGEESDEEPDADKKSDVFRMRPLHIAAMHDCVSAIKTLLAAGAQIKWKGWNFEYSALHRAVEHGHLEVVTFLVENKADVHCLSTEDFEAKPIDLAISTHQLAISKFLFVKMQNDFDKADLEYFLGDTLSHGSFAIFQFLQESGIQVGKTYEGKTVERICNDRLLEMFCAITEKGYQDKAQFFLDHLPICSKVPSLDESSPFEISRQLWGDNSQEQTKRLAYFLCAAVYAENENLVRQFLNLDLETLGIHWKTVLNPETIWFPKTDNVLLYQPLHVAVATGSIVIVQLLLKHGANANGKDFEKRTVVDYAIRSGDVKILAKLLEAGVDLVRDGCDYLKKAIYYRTPIIIKCLFEHTISSGVLDIQSEILEVRKQTSDLLKIALENVLYPDRYDRYDLDKEWRDKVDWPDEKSAPLTVLYYTLVSPCQKSISAEESEFKQMQKTAVFSKQIALFLLGNITKVMLQIDASPYNFVYALCEKYDAEEERDKLKQYFQFDFYSYCLNFAFKLTGDKKFTETEYFKNSTFCQNMLKAKNDNYKNNSMYIRIFEASNKRIYRSELATFISFLQVNCFNSLEDNVRIWANPKNIIINFRFFSLLSSNVELPIIASVDLAKIGVSSPQPLKIMALLLQLIKDYLPKPAVKSEGCLQEGKSKEGSASIRFGRS